MTAWTPFNINHNVRVKVTERGQRIHDEHWRSFGIKPPAIKRDDDGWTEMQMHEVMLIFGAGMVTGINPPLIETRILIGFRQDETR